MKKAEGILHFHSNGKFASLFVDPLILAERRRGLSSAIVTSEHLTGLGGRVIPYVFNLRNFLRVPLAFVKICLFIAQRNPELVISHNAKSSMIPLLAASLMGVKHRVYFNHGVPFVGYKGVFHSLLRALEMVNCSLATEVLTVSADMRDLLLEVKPSAKVSLVHKGSACGIDLKIHSAPLYAESSFMRDHGIAKEDFAVVFVGRPERRKGFELVLRLWRDRFSDPGYKLVLCGADSSDVLKVLSEVPSNVISMGFVGNIPEILSNTDCLILPSLHEGFSYAVLEAMACGCLVVANNIHGVRCLVRHGHNGFLIDDNSVTGYEELIRECKKRRGECSNIKQAALETASEYSREDFLPAYLTFIVRILDSSN
jgi:glycosyltransferase involved in cell wall biosynthesis